jgi:hypothetical protein
MKRTACLLGGLALLTAMRLPAQHSDSVPRPTLHVASQSRATRNVGRATVHWGKWLVAGSAVAFTVMGAHEHASSNREFGTLLSLCRANNADCLLGADGRYVNPAAEQLYQSSIQFDRRARVRLLAGQATLLVAAGLFIADLAHHASGPGNKPFAPLKLSVNERTGGALVGVRIRF